MGKVKIINKLAKEAHGEIIVITDANILHKPDSLKLLVRNFKNEKVGLVDSVMSHTGLDHTGISIQETTYAKQESRIKTYGRPDGSPFCHSRAGGNPDSFSPSFLRKLTAAERRYKVAWGGVAEGRGTPGKVTQKIPLP